MTAHFESIYSEYFSQKILQRIQTNNPDLIIVPNIFCFQLYIECKLKSSAIHADFIGQGHHARHNFHYLFSSNRWVNGKSYSFDVLSLSPKWKRIKYRRLLVRFGKSNNGDVDEWKSSWNRERGCKSPLSTAFNEPSVVEQKRCFIETVFGA